MSRQSIIQIALAEQGTTEVPPNSNLTKYGAWYGLNGEPWCAIFVSWVYSQAGYSLGDIENPNGYQSCQGGFNHWKATNEFTNDPQPADIVLYDWNGDGHCDHTGIFLKWLDDENTFQAIEGNTAVGNDSDGGQVMIRQRSRNTVKAFVSPKVLGQTSPPITNFNLAIGSKGSAVSNLQHLLVQLGFNIQVDGEFGTGTQGAVEAFQTNHNLSVTGIVTPALQGLIENTVHQTTTSGNNNTTGSTLRLGDKGAAVIALQNGLNVKGANPPITVDGIFGAGTLSAVRTFQLKNNLNANGIAGPSTFNALGIVNV